MAQSTWTKVPVEIIKDLIANSNAGFDAVRAKFDLGAPSTNGSGKNTSVVVSPNDATYTGNVTVNYDRLTLAAYKTVKVPTGSVQWGDTGGQTKLTASSSQADILAVVNSVFGTTLTTAMFSTLSVTEVTADTEYTVNLTAASTNLLFTGSTTFTVTQTAPPIQTNTVITSTDLAGLEAPAS